MIAIGTFFFKFRNLLFPIVALSIFIPSPPIFTEAIFGPNYYLIPLIAGLIVGLSGQIIRLATVGLKYIVRGGKNKEVYAEDLVIQGIFNHCRNPLYVGNILMLTGIGMISNSLIFMAVVAPFFIFIYQAIVLAEENYLKNKFGTEYTSYSNRVNRWIPNLRGLKETFKSLEFDWRRCVINEYNTVYLLLLAIGIVIFVFVPPVVDMNSETKLKLSGIIFLSLSGIYLYVRYLRKSKRLETKRSD